MADAEQSVAKGQHRTSLDTLEWTVGEGGRFAAFPLGDGPNDPIVVIVEYAPNTTIDAHAHDSDYFSTVLCGQMEVTRRPEKLGSMRHVRANTTYGPLHIGAEGCTVLEVFGDRVTFIEPRFARAGHAAAPTSVSTMPALFAQAIALAVAHLGSGVARVGTSE